MKRNFKKIKLNRMLKSKVLNKGILRDMKKELMKQNAL
jgi:hypothetical protein